MKRQKRAIAIGAAALIVAAAIGTTSAAAAPSDKNGGYVQLVGSAYQLYAPLNEVWAGEAPANQQVRFEAALPVRNQAALQSLAYAVSDPGNRLYGRFLSPEQYRAYFATTDDQARVVTSWLKSAGMKIAYNPDNHLMITATGTVAAAERAFKTDLQIVTGDGEDPFVAPYTDLFVPKSVAGIVDGFIEGINTPSRVSHAENSNGDSGDQTGADTTGRHHNGSVHTNGNTPAPVPGPPGVGFANARPCSDYWAQTPSPVAAVQNINSLPTTLSSPYAVPVPEVTCGYKPAQLQSAYGVTPLLQKGITGRGVTVAITDAYASPTIVQDINQYVANNGGAPYTRNQFRQVKPATSRLGYYDPAYGGDACDETGWYGEESLDVEAVHAMAPGANILYVGAASCLDQDLLGSLNDIVDNHAADIITNSWGGSNEIIDPTLLDVYNAVFLQAAVEGIGVFFSSGDAGDETDRGPRTVDLPASDPWVTAVGGTTLGIGATNNYLFEAPWGVSKDSITADQTAFKSAALPGPHTSGGGGGTSQLFAEPAYQQGVVPSDIANYFPATGPGRAVPDIAALADPSTGMLVGQTQTFADGVRYGEYRIGGTSLASPLMAGIEALADQAAGHAHGFANPAIYKIKAAALHDVVAPTSTLSVLRVDFVDPSDPNNTAGASPAFLYSLRTLAQTQTISARVGYDDTTGVGSPIASIYAVSLGRTH